MRTKPGIIIQARRGSSRFPDKVVRPFFKDLSILELLIDRFTRMTGFRTVVATTLESDDDLICEICKKKGVSYFRGSTNNVLHRFLETSKLYSLDPVIRVCSDNPFLLDSSPEELLKEFIKEKADYIGYKLSDKRIGILTHFGLWAELLTRSAMEKVLDSTTEKANMEHLTKYLYLNPRIFNIKYLSAPDSVYQRSDIRLTVDTEPDFNLVQRIYNLYISSHSSLNISELVKFIDNMAEWKSQMQKSIESNEK